MLLKDRKLVMQFLATFLNIPQNDAKIVTTDKNIMKGETESAHRYTQLRSGTADSLIMKQAHWSQEQYWL